MTRFKKMFFVLMALTMMAMAVAGCGGNDKKAAAPAEETVTADAVPETPAEPEPAASEEPPAAPRRGWWQRTFGE